MESGGIELEGIKKTGLGLTSPDFVTACLEGFEPPTFWFVAKHFYKSTLIQTLLSTYGCNVTEILNGVTMFFLFLEGITMRNFSIDIIWAKFQIAFTALGGWLGYFLGGMDGLLIALLVFVILDYVTGVMRAIANHELSSAIGFKGICRKVLIFALVGVGHVLDTHVVGTGSALRSAVICFYLSNEGISLLENASHLGLPVPDRLKTILEQIHGRSEKEDK